MPGLYKFTIFLQGRAACSERPLQGSADVRNVKVEVLEHSLQG